MSTPESKVKQAVKKELDAYPDHYREMPVPGGWGKSGLDFIVCFYGRFLSIETKAPGKEPTPRQQFTMREVRKAEGVATKVLSVEDAKTSFRALLKHISNYPAGNLP